MIERLVQQTSVNLYVREVSLEYFEADRIMYNVSEVDCCSEVLKTHFSY